jgi:hypothetical protein
VRRSFVVSASLFFLFALSAAAREPGARINGQQQAVTEGDSGLKQVSLTVTLPFPVNVPANGSYQTVDGTATVADNDYVPKSGTFVIPDGQTSSPPIILEIVGDRRVEPDETFQLVVTFSSGAQSPPPYTITIVNDDAPSISVGDVRVNEGNSATTPMNFVVTLNPAAAVPVQATYQTDPGTATAGVDYQSAQGALTFAPGETQKTVAVQVNGDTLFEPDETLTLTVTPVGGAKFTATGTIVNDDSLPAAKLVIVSGNNQQARLGQKLAQPLVVQLLNANNGPIAGAAVQWRVTKGQATLDSTGSTTDAQGRASTNLTLNSVGVVEVEASSSGFTATFTLGATTSFEQRAQGPVAVPIGRVLDTICARNETTFASVCRALSVLPDGDLTPTLERVAPQTSGAQSKVASEIVSAVTSGISARLAAVRAGVRGFSVADLSLDWHGRAVPITALSDALLPMISAQTDAGGSSDNDYNGWSAYLSGNLGSGERVVHPGELGFDLKSRGLMAGVDRLFGQNVFGVSLNLSRLDSDLDQNAGSVNVDSYALSIYGSRGGLFAGSAASDTGKGMRYDGMHIDGSITAGRNSYDSEHIVEITGMPTSRATSENDASVFALAGVTGFEAHNGRTDFDLSLSGAWSRADVDDLTEEGDGPLILFVNGHEIESLVGTASVSVKSAIPVSFGTLLPNFRAELIHEFKSSARLVTAHFLRDSLGTSFTIPIDQPDANYGKLAAGLQASFAHGVSAYVEATQDVMRSDLKFRTIQFIVSKSF